MPAALSTLCYIEKDDQYLMLHRIVKKNDINKDKWIGVGGHFEADESPEECVLREVKEETGYTLTSWRYRGLVTFVSGDGVTEYMSLFTADGFSGEPLPCDEGILEWVDKKKIRDLELWPGDKIFFRLLEEDVPFFSLKLVYDGHGGLVCASLNGQPMELLDILNEDGSLSGAVQERGVVHREGLLHETVHTWVVRKNGGSTQVLLQKRSMRKDSHPGCWDISSAGHIPAAAKNSPKDHVLLSALRELSEELGISASPEDLRFIGRHRACYDGVFHGKEFHNREYSHVFVYAGPVDESALSLQKEEIESVLWMDLSEVRDRLNDPAFPNCLYADELEMLDAYLH